MIPNKKILSRTIKKHESVAEKMVSRSGNRTHIFFFGLTCCDHHWPTRSPVLTYCDYWPMRIPVLTCCGDDTDSAAICGGFEGQWQRQWQSCRGVDRVNNLADIVMLEDYRTLAPPHMEGQVMDVNCGRVPGFQVYRRTRRMERT